MKKHILSICFLATLALSSCSDWLNVQPSTQRDRDSFLSTEVGYGEALVGIYTQMAAPELYGRHMTFGLMDMFGKVYSQVAGSGSWISAANNYAYSTANYVNAPLQSMVWDYWNKLYNAIAGLNSMLEKIDDHKDVFTDDNYTIIKGEAIGLRAFLHFEILRLFGDIYERCRDEKVMPFVYELTTLVSPELTGEQIVTVIINELETALEMLANDPMLLGVSPSPILATPRAEVTYEGLYSWHNRRFHFNYFAAKATLARVHLWKGDKPAALAAAKEVIDYQATRFPWVQQAALTNIGSTTDRRQDRTFASEHIFALNIPILENLIEGYHKKSPLTEGPMGAGWYVDVSIFPSDEQSVDIRYTRLTVSDPTQWTPSFSLTKYYQIPVVDQALKERLPLIRISEMYYIAAECAPTWEEGWNYLKTVRNARFVGAYQLPVSDAASLQNEIYNEYRKEFMGEGQLWHYYKRHQFASIPGAYNFKVAYYLFPRPENEDLYGNRE